MQPATELAAHLAGFVCAEGTFVASDRRFAFRVALGATDAAMCHLLRAFLGVGEVYELARRKPHYDDEVVYSVQRLRGLVEVIVPFMDEHLAPSHKREQYEQWRAALLTYWESGARRRRTCTIDGCDAPHRSRGLCRRHLYAQFGV